MAPLLATLPVTQLVRGPMPLVLLAIFLGGALFALHRLSKRSPDWSDLVAVFLAPIVYGALGFGGLHSHWPEDAIMGFFATGFGYLAARLAWSSRSQLIRRIARAESVFFGALLLLQLCLSVWLRLDWWWEHH